MKNSTRIPYCPPPVHPQQEPTMNRVGSSLPQRQNPSGTTTEQYASNQMQAGGNYTAKESKGNLRDKAQDIKKCVEELDREVDTVMELVEKIEKKVRLLGNHNRKMANVNESLSVGLTRKPSMISQHEDYKANRPSTVRLQNGDRYFEPERVIACHSRDSQEDLNEEPQRSSKLHKNKHVVISMTGIKNMPVDEQEDNQTFSALSEGDNPEENSIMSSKPSQSSYDVWDFVTCSLAAVLGFGFCTCLILFCAYYFNYSFLVNSIIPFCDHDIAELTQLLSPYFTWRNNGLLPF